MLLVRDVGLSFPSMSSSGYEFLRHSSCPWLFETPSPSVRHDSQTRGIVLALTKSHPVEPLEFQDYLVLRVRHLN
jgi:hypothetical protein